MFRGRKTVRTRTERRVEMMSRGRKTVRTRTERRLKMMPTGGKTVRTRTERETRPGMLLGADTDPSSADWWARGDSWRVSSLRDRSASPRAGRAGRPPAAWRRRSPRARRSGTAGPWCSPRSGACCPVAADRGEDACVNGNEKRPVRTQNACYVVVHMPNYHFYHHILNLCWHVTDYVSLRFVTFRHVSLRFVSLRFVTFRFVSLRFVTFRCVTFRYVSLRFVSSV